MSSNSKQLDIKEMAGMIYKKIDKQLKRFHGRFYDERLDRRIQNNIIRVLLKNKVPEKISSAIFTEYLSNVRKNVGFVPNITEKQKEKIEKINAIKLKD